jgi:hypothetical protein
VILYARLSSSLQNGQWKKRRYVETTRSGGFLPLRSTAAELSVGLCSLPAPSPPLSVPRVIQVVLDQKGVTRPSALVVFAVFLSNRTNRGPHSLDRPHP